MCHPPAYNTPVLSTHTLPNHSYQCQKCQMRFCKCKCVVWCITSIFSQRWDNLKQIFYSLSNENLCQCAYWQTQSPPTTTVVSAVKVEDEIDKNELLPLINQTQDLMHNHGTHLLCMFSISTCLALYLTLISQVINDGLDISNHVVSLGFMKSQGLSYQIKFLNHVTFNLFQFPPQIL